MGHIYCLYGSVFVLFLTSLVGVFFQIAVKCQQYRPRRVRIWLIYFRKSSKIKYSSGLASLGAPLHSGTAREIESV